MNVEYSDRASERMKRREIAPESVVAVLESPDMIVSKKRGVIARKAIDGKRLSVVHSLKDDRCIVVNAYFARKRAL